MKKAMKRVNIKFLFWILLIALLLPFYLIYFNNTIPFTEGWGIYYVELMKKGLIPYKDFYYYLPPVNLGIDYIFWSCSNGLFIVYRFWRLIERLLMITIVYMLLSKYFKPQYVFISTFAGGVLGTAVVYDLLGDYNQTSELFIILLCCLVVKYVETEKQKKRYIILFLIGFGIALTFLLKQSSGVAVGIVYAITFCIYSRIKKNKFFVKEIFFVLLGILVPISICGVWLIFKGAFLQFIEQVYLSGSNSKGGLINIIFLSMISNFKNYPELILFLSLVLIIEYYLISCSNAILVNKDIRIITGLCLFLMPILCCFVFYKEEVYALYMFCRNHSLLMLSFFIIAITTFLLSRYFLKKLKYVSFEYSISFTIIIIGFLGLLFGKYTSIFGELNDTGLFSLISNAGVIVLFALLFAWLYMLKKISGEKLLKYDIWLMLFASALATTYAASMAAGTSMPAVRPMFLSIPIISAILLELGTEKNITYCLKNVAVIIVVATMCITTFAQKYMCSYSWWGWSEANYAEKNEKINIHGLEGFRVSKKQKEIYEEVTALIQKNTTKDSIVYGFPYLKIFNILTNKIGDPGFVPVPFYDVCGDEYAINEVEYLEKNEPDIVLWCDIPGCLETHEYVFREGHPIGQRKIVEWFQNAIKNKEYINIGQVDNVFVYKKKDGDKKAYTFFENSERKNVTLEEYQYFE